VSLGVLDGYGPSKFEHLLTWPPLRMKCPDAVMVPPVTEYVVLPIVTGVPLQPLTVPVKWILR
jgi:hypothetical protein